MEGPGELYLRALANYKSLSRWISLSVALHTLEEASDAIEG